MKFRFLALGALSLSACAQSAQVFVPVNNTAINNTPVVAQNTLTVNVSLTTYGNNHATKPFSILVFQDATLVAAQYNDGTVQTDGYVDNVSPTPDDPAAASVVLNAVNPSTGCPLATPAALANGTYTMYFAIQYAAEGVTTTNPGCGANGWIMSSSGGNLYGTKATFPITTNTTYNIGDTIIPKFRQHTFSFATGSGWGYRCYVTDINITTYTSTVQPLSIYERSGDGTTTGIGATIHLLPTGVYRYFCYANTNGGADYFETGIDKLATGSLTVTGAGTTSLAASDFSNL